MVVVAAQVFPKRLPIVHPIVPCHMVKPQQKRLRTCLQIVIQGTQWLGILCHIVRAFGTQFCMVAAVKAYANRIGTVIIARQPVLAPPSTFAPRLWSVVMVCSKDVVQPHRHHIVHQRFVTSHEQVRHRTNKAFVARIILAKEILCNLARLCCRVTR